MYLDVDGNGVKDTGEPTQTTDALGHYTFSAMGPGNYAVRQVVPAGLRQTTPASNLAFAVALGTGQQSQSVNFGTVVNAAVIASRRLFYNNSALDGNNAAPNAPVLNGWLEVTMKTNAVTGLSKADVFAFGNLVGDANGDRGVTVGDLGILATNFNKPSGATIAQGDFNGDGAVTVGDLGILSTNFNRTLALPPAGLLAGDAAIPKTLAKTAAAATPVTIKSRMRSMIRAFGAARSIP